MRFAERAALRYRAQRSEQLVRRRRLQDVPIGPQRDRFRDTRVIVVHRQEQEARVRRGAAHLRSDLQTVATGHRDVEENDIGCVLRDQRQAFVSAAGFGHDLESVLCVDRLHEALPNKRVILNDDDSSHVLSSTV